MLHQVEKQIFSCFGAKLPGNPPEKPGWRAKKRSSVGISPENLGQNSSLRAVTAWINDAQKREK